VLARRLELGVVDLLDVEHVEVREELRNHLVVEEMHHHLRAGLAVQGVAGVDTLRASTERATAHPATAARGAREPGQQIGPAGRAPSPGGLRSTPQTGGDDRLVRDGVAVLAVGDLAEGGALADLS
jgi:hypothetical protein